MKLTKKKVLAVALSVCLIAILSMGSLAWFNANDSVVNNFYVADSDDEGNAPDFSIDLYETGNDDGEKEDNGNTYNDITPGSTYAKDPTVKNTGKYDQWVRVIVTVSDYRTWAAALEKVATIKGGNFADYDLTTIFGGYDGDAWQSEVVGVDQLGDDTQTYVFYLKEKLAPGSTATLFDSFIVPDLLEAEDMDFGDDGFSINIKAEAIQTANLDQNGCKAAFDTVGWTVGMTYDAAIAAANSTVQP